MLEDRRQKLMMMYEANQPNRYVPLYCYVLENLLILYVARCRCENEYLSQIRSLNCVQHVYYYRQQIQMEIRNVENQMNHYRMQKQAINDFSMQQQQQQQQPNMQQQSRFLVLIIDV